MSEGNYSIKKMSINVFTYKSGTNLSAITIILNNQAFLKLNDWLDKSYG